MMFAQFIRSTWLKLRIGFSSYFSYGLAFFNLILLISLRFPDLGPIFYFILTGTLGSAAVAIGHYHIKWQQTTDVKLQYQWMIDEIVRRLKEEK